MKEKSQKYYIITFREEEIASFWIEETKDGYTYGPRIDGVDIHSTVFRKNGKIRSHIKHTGIEHPPDQYPIGKQVSEKHFLISLLKELSTRIRKYHGNSKCRIFTEDLWMKVKPFLPRINEKGDYIIPIEFLFLEVKADYNNPKIWEKVRIRELLNGEQFFGLKEYPEGLRIVIPVSENVLYQFPVSKINKPIETIYDNFGMKDFFDYFFETDEGKSFEKRMKERVKEMQIDGKLKNKET